MSKLVFVLISTCCFLADADQCRADLLPLKRFKTRIPVSQSLMVPTIAKFPADSARTNADLFYSTLLLEINGLLFSEHANTAYPIIQRKFKVLPAKTLKSKLLKAKISGDVFAALGQVGKAKVQYVLMLKLARLKKAIYTQMLVDLLLKKHLKSWRSNGYSQNDAAHELLNKIIIADSPYLKPAARADFYRILFKLDSAARNYEQSFAYYQQYKIVTDSLFRQEKQMRLKAMQQKFILAKQRPKAESTNISRAGVDRHSLKFAAVIVAVCAFSLCFWKVWDRRKKQKDLTVWINRETLLTENAIKDLLNDQARLKVETQELLKEAHHKVKNNLQMVMSLLSTQAKYLNNGTAIDVIDESQDRLQTMMIMHQKLYGSDETTEIDMVAYIAELAAYLTTKLAEKGVPPTLKFYADPILMGNTQAVLAGLFIGEAISNTLKIIDEKTLSCIVSICLLVSSPGMIRLSIASQTTSLNIKSCSYNLSGAIMMKALSDQLHGFFQIEQVDGVTVSVEFRHEKEVEHY
ncbi:sensor histidine kinase [Mucilaginibacter phyllosphaerae]